MNDYQITSRIIMVRMVVCPFYKDGQSLQEVSDRKRVIDVTYNKDTKNTSCVIN
jgi:hypothetical protein